jgi:hypothetical protein
MDNAMNNIKKIFLCVLSLIMLSTFSLVGCKDDDYGSACKNGNHTFGAYVYNNDATCTEDGTETASCTNPYCGAKDTRVSAEHKKTGHSISFVEEKPSSCTERGVYEHYECDNCNAIFSDQNGTQPIENPNSIKFGNLGHEYPLDSSQWEIIVEAQKNQPGKKRQYCQREGCDHFRDVPYALEDDGFVPNV